MLQQQLAPEPIQLRLPPAHPTLGYCRQRLSERLQLLGGLPHLGGRLGEQGQVIRSFRRRPRCSIGGQALLDLPSPLPCAWGCHRPSAGRGKQGGRGKKKPSVKIRTDTVGEPPSAEHCASHMPLLKGQEPGESNTAIAAVSRGNRFANSIRSFVSTICTPLTASKFKVCAQNLWRHGPTELVYKRVVPTTDL